MAARSYKVLAARAANYRMINLNAICKALPQHINLYWRAQLYARGLKTMMKAEELSDLLNIVTKETDLIKADLRSAIKEANLQAAA